jgi:integrase/recombinase XerC/integrase/recombinase XerD
MASTETDTNTRATAWLKPRQVRELRTAAQSDAFQPYLRDRNEALVAMLYDTGLRVGELAAVKNEYLHLDDDPAYLAIPAHIQKDYPTDRSPQYEEMNLAQDGSTYDTGSRLQAFLNTRWKDSEHLFPSRQADSMTTESIRRVVASLAREAGVRPQTLTGDRGDPDDVTPHTLRHSVAFRLLHEEEGYTLYDVRNRLRHASIQTTERNYDHFDRI